MRKAVEPGWRPARNILGAGGALPRLSDGFEGMEAVCDLGWRVVS